MKGRFLYLTDSHWTRNPGVPPHKGVWQKELFDTHCEQLERAAVNLIRKVSPDFVIHGGDLCREFNEHDWPNAKRIIDSFPVPCHFVPGNHDSQDDEHRRRMIEIFRIPEGRLYFTREIGGLSFIFLDSTYLWRKDAPRLTQPSDADYVSQNVKSIGVSPEQIVWLEQVLSGPLKDRPSVIITHCPMVGKGGYPVKFRKERPIDVSLPGWDDHWMADIHGGWIMPLEERRAELLMLMRRHGQVRLVMAGHMHASNISVLDGIVHCTTSPMSAWPFEMRLIDFDDTGFRIDTVQVDDPELIAASYRPDWNNEWVAGMSDYDRRIEFRW